MEFEIYIMYDAAKEIYNSPMCFTNDADSMRSFAHEAMKEDSLVHTHPSDFILYNVGTFYENTGEIISHKPERVCAGNDFVKPKTKRSK